MAKLPIQLSVSPEAQSLPSYASKLVFNSTYKNNGLSAEESLRRALLITFGWAVGYTDAHTLSSTELIAAVKSGMESHDGLIYETDPTRGINLVIEPPIEPSKENGYYFTQLTFACPTPSKYNQIFKVEVIEKQLTVHVSGCRSERFEGGEGQLIAALLFFAFPEKREFDIASSQWFHVGSPEWWILAQQLMGQYVEEGNGSGYFPYAVFEVLVLPAPSP